MLVLVKSGDVHSVLAHTTYIHAREHNKTRNTAHNVNKLCKWLATVRMLTGCNFSQIKTSEISHGW